ncbi:MAG: hypothetical protein HFI05_14735 [Lachnospiraceae bacterium]|jgi:hypothetical protein|nr:hypothetical protein [Lachnospiraceae bacterium]
MKNKLPSIAIVYYWVGNVIMACSIFAIVILLAMKVIMKEMIYISDILILIGFALIGYAMRKVNQNKVEQEDKKNE